MIIAASALVAFNLIDRPRPVCSRVRLHVYIDVSKIFRPAEEAKNTTSEASEYSSKYVLLL